jgi:hypothetical protein
MDEEAAVAYASRAHGEAKQLEQPRTEAGSLRRTGRSPLSPRGAGP